MGRKRKFPASKVNYNDALKRHRSADTKYRSKVQHLYKLLKNEVLSTTTKDNLLTEALMYIQNTEETIIDALGSKKVFEQLKEFFLSYLKEDGSIWKEDKNVDNWWMKMQDFLQNELETVLISANIQLSNKDESPISFNCTDENFENLVGRNSPIKVPENVESSDQSSFDSKDQFSSHYATNKPLIDLQSIFDAADFTND